MSRLAQRLRRLDQRVLGRSVSDNRPIVDRVLRPRPAVWSRRGRFAYSLILVGMFAAYRWLPESVGTCVLIGLVAASFVVVAADERRRARQHWRDKG